DRTGRLHKRTFDDPLPRYLFTDPRVKVLRPPEEDDLGTLDMLVPTLRALRARPPPGCAAPQRVWVVNDDVEYDAGLLESLLACAARHPSAACGSTGGRGYYGVLHKDLAGGTDDELRRVQPFLRAGGEVEVEWLQSVGGILYRTDFFAEDFLSFPRDADERILLEADWWFAGYLRARGVSLLHLPVLRPWWRALRSSVVNALSRGGGRATTQPRTRPSCISPGASASGVHGARRLGGRVLPEGHRPRLHSALGRQGAPGGEVLPGGQTR
ncbi:unnamed protein product, partial [Prorocentrum cordatum]